MRKLTLNQQQVTTLWSLITTESSLILYGDDWRKIALASNEGEHLHSVLRFEYMFIFGGMLPKSATKWRCDHNYYNHIGCATCRVTLLPDASSMILENDAGAVLAQLDQACFEEMSTYMWRV
jgi:hypothetical protein